MDLIAALGQTFDHTQRVVAGVTPGQMGNATPCAEWDLKALLSHTFGVVAGIGAAVSGSAPPAGKEIALEADLAGQFRGLADTTLAAWKAAGLEGETNIGAGPMPRQAAIGINLLDTATHAWDIARATGQPEELPDDLAGLILGICQGIISDDVRKFAGFSPAATVGANATPTQQLVAFLGRQP